MNVKDILKLQDIDSEIDELISEKKNLDKKIQEHLDRSKVNQLEKRVDSFKEEVEEHEKEHKRKQDSLERLELKIKGEEEKLYSAKGMKAKEVETLQKEVESLKRRDKKLKEEISLSEERLSKNKERLEKAVKLLDDFREDTEGELKEIKKRLKEIDGKIKKLQKKRKSAEKKVDNKHLKIYRALKQRHGGAVITKIEEEACSGCYIELSKEEIEEIENNPEKLHQCSNCGRIVYK